MLLRKKFLPNSLSDAAVMLFVIGIIPAVFWFEVFVVFPSYFELWSYWYMFHILLGLFCLMNITGNYVAIILCDTSIQGRMLQISNDPNWKFCTVCESVVPPRSWHCSTCNICILKRDHHCLYTGCCIGHYNQRYFLMFIFYIFFSTTYVMLFNFFFVWKEIRHDSVMSLIVSFALPLAMLAWDLGTRQIYILLSVVVTIACVLTGVLLYYHVNLVLSGTIVYEHNKKIHDYDLGKKENIRHSLGERWKLVWLSPFVESKLPSDGIHWTVKETIKQK